MNSVLKNGSARLVMPWKPSVCGVRITTIAAHTSTSRLTIRRHVNLRKPKERVNRPVKGPALLTEPCYRALGQVKWHKQYEHELGFQMFKWLPKQTVFSMKIPVLKYKFKPIFLFTSCNQKPSLDLKTIQIIIIIRFTLLPKKNKQMIIYVYFSVR